MEFQLLSSCWNAALFISPKYAEGKAITGIGDLLLEGSLKLMSNSGTLGGKFKVDKHSIGSHPVPKWAATSATAVTSALPNSCSTELVFQALHWQQWGLWEKVKEHCLQELGRPVQIPAEESLDDNFLEGFWSLVGRSQKYLRWWMAQRRTI